MGASSRASGAACTRGAAGSRVGKTSANEPLFSCGEADESLPRPESADGISCRRGAPLPGVAMAPDSDPLPVDAPCDSVPDDVPDDDDDTL